MTFVCVCVSDALLSEGVYPFINRFNDIQLAVTATTIAADLAHGLSDDPPAVYAHLDSFVSSVLVSTSSWTRGVESASIKICGWRATPDGFSTRTARMRRWATRS